MINLSLVFLLIYIFNIPFGYWRANVKKFSIQWFLSVHLPVPFVIFLRFYAGIGFELYTYPILVGAFFLGQFTGSYFFNYRKKNELLPQSSCMVMDFLNKRKIEG